MDYQVVAVCVIALALVVLVVVLIPTILQLKRTLTAAEGFIKDMDGSLKTLIDDDLKTMIRSTNDTMEEMAVVVRSARETAEKLEDTAEAFHEVGQTVRHMNQLLDSKVNEMVANVASIWAGIKVGMMTLASVSRHCKQKEVE